MSSATLHEVAVVGRTLVSAKQFAALLYSAAGGPVVHVANKYFTADVAVVPYAEDDDLPAGRVAGVVQLVSSRDPPPFVLCPNAAFHVLVALKPLPQSQEDALANRCLDAGVEFVAPDGADGFAPVDTSAARQGLLASDEARGATRVWQLLHQTIWRGAQTITDDVDTAGQPAPNAVLMVANGDDFATKLVDWCDLESAAGPVLRTKYYAATLSLEQLPGGATALAPAMIDTAVVAVMRRRPSALIVACNDDAGVTSALRFFRRLPDGMPETRVVVVTSSEAEAAPIVSKAAEEAFFEAGVEVVNAASSGFDDEAGAEGRARLREILECVEWRSTEAPVAEAAAVSDAPVAEPAAAPPAPDVRTTLDVLLVSHSVPDLAVMMPKLFPATKTPASCKRTDVQKRVTVRVDTAYAEAELSALLMQRPAPGASFADTAATAFATIVFAGMEGETEEHRAAVGEAFAATFGPDPDAWEGDERLRLLCVQEGGEEGADRYLAAVPESLHFAVEVVDLQAPEEAFGRLREAVDSCMWPSLQRKSKPPARLVFGCEPPPGFAVDAEGRTRRVSAAKADGKKKKKDTSTASAGDKAGGDTPDEWLALAEALRDHRGKMGGMDRDTRYDNAEALAHRFAKLLDDDSA